VASFSRYTVLLLREEYPMNMKCICREILIAGLIVTLSMVPFTNAVAQSRAAKPRPESSLPTKGQVDGAVAGIVVGIVATTAVVVYLLMRKPTITGCVTSGQNGMTLTAENGTHPYALAGNTAGVTPGNRMKLAGKKEKSTANSSPVVWDTEKVSKDYGACRP
jgi:hypothetical protein